MMNEKKNPLNNIPNIFGKNVSGVKVYNCGVKKIQTPQTVKTTTLNTITKNTPYNPYIRKEGGR